MSLYLKKSFLLTEKSEAKSVRQRIVILELTIDQKKLIEEIC